ncbi:PAAR domain-containing protein [Pseudomonas sp. B21-047]|uniref:PAAR domain-containing protein n=1 Tax=Pseudomonas sp. B21-047 TaxID=2895489 RepID=UPI00215E6785|nr:PAAR domain-containing protein [Pseudomonas sp. B21-047]UVL06297.1 PAAR domain-containing protein [Pseudomonas sp. B21-047]
MTRISIHGKGQALDGDITTTGAVCIASSTNYRGDNRRALRLGDATTECPNCKKVGVIVEGVNAFVIGGKPAVVDGALVKCDCPNGSNRVIAQSAMHRASSRPAQAASPASAVSHSAPSSGQSPAQVYNASPVGSLSILEPGFHIVQSSMSFEQVLQSLGATHSPLPVALLQRLNPTFPDGFKAGEIFVLGSPSSGHACSALENELIMVAEKTRESLSILSREEANFMMKHIGEIAGVLNGASQSMGVGKDMLERGLGQVKDTLKGIEALHQQQFVLHGHLNSAEFFAKRRGLYEQLSAQLRVGFLNKTLNLGSYDTLRRDLGISTKSLVHHWTKAGVPGQIPGYATHLDEVAKMSNYLKYGGFAAIGLGAGASYLNVQAACRAGETEACKKIRFTETGSFAGGLLGGAAGGKVGSVAAAAVCSFGVYGKAVCGIVAIGSGSYLGSKTGEKIGEGMIEWTYEVLHD